VELKIFENMELNYLNKKNSVSPPHSNFQLHIPPMDAILFPGRLRPQGRGIASIGRGPKIKNLYYK